MADHIFHAVTEPKRFIELANISGAEIQNADEDMLIHDVATLDRAGGKDISFFDNVKYKNDLKNTKAAACVISAKMATFAPKGCALLISKNPYKAYALIAQAFYPVVTPAENISDKAIVSKSADIAKGCYIEAGAIIGENVKLAENCWIESGAVIGHNVQIGKNSHIGVNASVSHAIIGEGSRIYAGARIGQDGFGFAIDPAGHVKVPQLGRVIIGDHVEIGANSCIDRGAGPDTIIGDGTWIDNLVQIAHNVKIGKGCVVVSQVGIAGSSTLEDYVVLAGQAGVAGHVKIGMGSRIAAQSGVMKDVPEGVEFMGAPAMPAKQYLRQIVALKKITQKN